ncbi:hypothetical protein [Bacillus infantis]|uniref:hypothetical protein n=1 Tax=Bacillus infantis TaxID=324767 RepID=UPI0020A1E501|nr:hypothetical protein [Bacillus infantis]MCP1159280.1 hypothetical protein [Bacillus infantis]
MDIKRLEDNVEFLAQKVHGSWEAEKRGQGFHAPLECQSENRNSYERADWKAKERFDDHFNPKFYKWCDKCHADLYPYEELAENIKEYDRVTVRTVLNAIKEL